MGTTLFIRGVQCWNMDYESALQYPARGDWFPRVLLGGGLLAVTGVLYLLGWFTTMFLVGFAILPLALIPYVLLHGYYVRVLRRTSHGDADPPGFDDPVSLFVDGLKGVGITLAYLSPVVVLAVVGFGVAVGLSVAYPDSSVGTVAFMAMAWIGAPILGLASIAINYFKAAGLASFAHEGDVRAAFDADRVEEASFSKTWFVAYVVGWGIGLAGNVLTLGGIGYLLLFGFFVQFYVGTVRYHVFGQAYAESVDDVAVDPTGSAPVGTGGDWETVSSGDAPADAVRDASGSRDPGRDASSSRDTDQDADATRSPETDWSDDDEDDDFW